MKRKVIATMLAATLALSLAGCGGSSGSSGSSDSSSSSESSTANKDKPLCWFNRQPSNSSTGELDQEALKMCIRDSLADGDALLSDIWCPCVGDAFPNVGG